MNLLIETIESPRSEEDVSHLEAERYESLGDEIVRQDGVISQQGDEIVRQNGVIIQQGDEIDSLKCENTRQDGVISQQGDEIVRQNGVISQQGDEIVRQNGVIIQQGDEIASLRSDFCEERREKACMEIAFGIQDVNANSLLETNSLVKKRGLSALFKSLRETRHEAAHFLRHNDPPDTIIYKKDAFIRILENSNCLQDELDAEGITGDVIAVVLDVLRNEVQNVKLPTPKQAEVTNVDKFFKNTLRTLEKKRIKDL
jgi:hypothetical protein